MKNTPSKEVQTVTILCGLPGSHKSDYARRLLQRCDNTVIIAHDDIRTMTYGRYKFDETDEPYIHAVARFAIKKALDDGRNIIIDDSDATISAQRRRWMVNDIRTRNFRPNTNIYIIGTEFCIDVVGSKEARMADNRGLSPQKWCEVIDLLHSQWEPLNDSELRNGEGFNLIERLDHYTKWDC